MLNIILLPSYESSRQATVDGRPLVHTMNGTYAGVHLDTLNQDVFLGMPYAISPLGRLRFRHPRSLTDSWGGVRDAAAYGPQCPGYGNDLGTYTHAEDCLKINIIRPANAYQSPLPVAVYIYGAGAKVGGSDNQRYNMSFIVKTASDAGLPFIGVSFTYRASVGGWIISRQVRGSGDTNIGFHDQRMALRWIQDNIASFGGDPRKVTLWGGSSGARDVACHLTAYGGRDDRLFRAAIMQSGCAVEETSSRRFPAQELYDDLVAGTSCSEAEDSLDCLRGIPYEEINKAFTASKYGIGTMASVFGGPSIDGSFLSNYGSLSLKSSRVVKVPVISGIVSNEGSNQIPGNVRNWPELREYLIDYLLYPEPAVDRLMDLYPPVIPGSDDKLEPPIEGISISSRSEFDRIEQLMGDLSNNAGARLTCESYATITSCYAFIFAATVSSVYDERLGVRHGAEIGPVFQNFDGVGWDVNPFSGKGEGLRHMSHTMGIMWAGFITSLDPNVGLSHGELNWPEYSESARRTMIFHENGSWIEKVDRRSDALEYINTIQHSIFER
ncbi:putative carboxylesterase [Xylaria scruposa]|nr:putative carboxylesterase [Xylaria scruposa]